MCCFIMWCCWRWCRCWLFLCVILLIVMDEIKVLCCVFRYYDGKSVWMFIYLGCFLCLI